MIGIFRRIAAAWSAWNNRWTGFNLAPGPDLPTPPIIEPQYGKQAAKEE